MDCEFPEDWDDGDALPEEEEEDLSLLDVGVEDFDDGGGELEEPVDAAEEASEGLEEAPEEDLEVVEAGEVEGFETTDTFDDAPPDGEEEDLGALEAAACASFEEGDEIADESEMVPSEEDLAALEAAACESYESAAFEDDAAPETGQSEGAAADEEMLVGRRNVRATPGTAKQYPSQGNDAKGKGKGKGKGKSKVPPWKQTSGHQAPKASAAAGVHGGLQPRTQPPTKGTPKGSAPKGAAPKGGAPKGGAPKGGAPKGGAPKGSAPKGGTPKGGPPKGTAAKGQGWKGAAGKANGAGRDAAGAQGVRRPAQDIAEGPAAKRRRPETEAAAESAPATRTVTVKLRLPPTVADKLKQLSAKGVKLRREALDALGAAVPNDAAVLLQALLNRGQVDNPSRFVIASLAKRNASVAAKGKAAGKSSEAPNSTAGKNGKKGGGKGSDAKGKVGGKAKAPAKGASNGKGSGGAGAGKGQPPRARKDMEFDRMAVQGKLLALNKQGVWSKKGPHPLDESALAALLRIEGARALEILDEVEAQGVGLADPSRYARELAGEEEQVHDS